LDALDFNQPLYLSINVNGDGEMSPRKVLGAVSNAFNSEKFGGFSTSSFLRSDIANATGTINNLNSQYLYVSGNVGIGIANPSTALSVLGIASSTGLRVNGSSYFSGNTDMSAGSFYKYNGINLAYASTTKQNYFFGEAGNLTMTGSYNVAIGYRSLFSNLSGGLNTSMGYQALYRNETGSNNTALGNNSSPVNTSGSNNTTLGASSFHESITGSDNTAIGMSALYASNGGINNTALGSNAGYGGGSSNYNSVLDNNMVFVGTQASRDGLIVDSGTALSNGIAIGYQSRVGGSNMMALGGMGTNAVLVGIGTSTPNAFLNIFGSSSSNDLLRIATAANQSILFVSKTGNVGIGTSTPNNLLQVYDLIDFDNVNYDTNLGYLAGKNSIASLGGNTYVGYQAGWSSSTAATTTAIDNTALGYQSLLYNYSGQQNTAIGYASMRMNDSGNYNTAVGINSLLHNVSGERNVALGLDALHNNLTGSQDVAVGMYALSNLQDVGWGRHHSPWWGRFGWHTYSW
ncbi:MAG: hypothetical protein WCV68_04110, partial [Candidatus Paceibacterota bacterium]